MQAEGELFVGVDMKRMGDIMKWLNDLIGADSSKGKIVKVIEWQVVPSGRPYEYSAFARVEVQHG